MRTGTGMHSVAVVLASVLLLGLVSLELSTYEYFRMGTWNVKTRLDIKTVTHSYS